jgi:hypothetical protein
VAVGGWSFLIKTWPFLGLLNYVQNAWRLATLTLAEKEKLRELMKIKISSVDDRLKTPGHEGAIG